MPEPSAERIVGQVQELQGYLRSRMCHFPVGRNEPNLRQLHALLLIREKEGMTMKEFASALGITRPSATSLAGRLVRLTLVRRVSDPKNRKLVRLRLTSSAARMVDRKLAQRDAMLASVFSLLPEADRRDLSRILDRLLTSLASGAPR